eukprot:305908_1
MPYFVLSTPEKGWTVNDFGLFFSAIAIGEIAGSQIVPLASILDSNPVLFVGHVIQIIAAFVGYFLMSSIAFFNLWSFAAGMFLLGFSNGMTCVQAYCVAIADGDENMEVDLMEKIGQLIIVSNISMSFIFPIIYETMGYTAYCVVMMSIVIVMFIALVVLIICLNKKDRGDAYAVDIDDDHDKEEISHHELEEELSPIKNVELDQTNIPILNILSPSMYMLLVLKLVQCFCHQVYAITYPVVFSQDFGISSQTGGFLCAGASVLGLIVLFLNGKITNYFAKWQYPYDFILYFG